MSPRPSINPGKVDWSGDNAGIYLKERPEGPYVTLASYFRVVVSPHGPGRALVLIEADEALRLCLTDNEPLARWLVAEFARHFQQFRGRTEIEVLYYRPLHDAATSGDGLTNHVERIRGDGIDVWLTWEQLGKPFMVELPAAQSATGRHEMFSLFIDAGTAAVFVNGRRLNGQVFPRDYAGRPSTTSFLAFSETWVRP